MSASQDHDIVHYGGAGQSERPVGRSIMRGFLNTCPACGGGKLFRGFLKPVDNCPACSEEMFHQRADDLPPYLVIFVVGHVAVGGFMMTDLVFPMSMWLHLAIWAPLTALAGLFSIQPIKGGVIGLQWALRMHGFGGHEDDAAEIPGGDRSA